MADGQQIIASKRPFGARSAEPREAAVLIDGSFDAFLNVVYAHFYEKVNPVSIGDEDQYQQILGAETLHIEPDHERALRVLGGIREKIGGGAEGKIYSAFINDGQERYMAIYQYIILGFKVGPEVDAYEKFDFVLRVRKLAGMVGHEIQLLRGFTRFALMENGVYYAHIEPKSNVLEFLAEHFSERLMNQQWVIHDQRRGLAAIYDGERYVIREVPRDINVEFREGEEIYQDLWRVFYKTIGVEGRVSHKRQRQMLPLYFRKHMTEFEPISSKYTKPQSKNLGAPPNHGRPAAPLAAQESQTPAAPAGVLGTSSPDPLILEMDTE